MNLRLLYIIHALVTFAAGIVLIIAPALIPSTVNILLSRETFLICYLLGAAEIAISFLSFAARKITDEKSQRIIASTMIVFHAATALVEYYAIVEGSSEKLWGNIVLRIIIIVLFWHYGIRKREHAQR